jgi:hypothetical protein
MKILMHKTTYDYIFKSIQQKSQNPTKIFAAYNGAGFNFPNYTISFSETCSPTIDEPEWVFPESKFVKYEKSDMSWCKFFGIGRPGIFKMGDIFIIEQDARKPLLR